MAGGRVEERSEEWWHSVQLLLLRLAPGFHVGFILQHLRLRMYMYVSWPIRKLYLHVNCACLSRVIISDIAKTHAQSGGQRDRHRTSVADSIAQI